MSQNTPTILVTGATGQLGRLTLAELAKRMPASGIIAAVRSPESAHDLATAGFDVREADYDRPETLDAAFEGVDRVLLISSNQVGQRIEQHRHVVDAAKRAKVAFIAYTSILHADRTPLDLAIEHRDTENYILASAIPHAILRNGWYLENHTAGIPGAIEHSVVLGCAGEGRFSSAARADYAEAAAVVLSARVPDTASIYELAGDGAYTKAQFAAEISRLTGNAIDYRQMDEADYKSALTKAGLPEEFAQILANSDAGASTGALFDEERVLSRLIGRPTTSLEAAISATMVAAR